LTTDRIEINPGGNEVQAGYPAGTRITVEWILHQKLAKARTRRAARFWRLFRTSTGGGPVRGRIRYGGKSEGVAHGEKESWMARERLQLMTRHLRKLQFGGRRRVGGGAVIPGVAAWLATGT